MNILIVHNYYKYPGGEDTVVLNEMNMLKGHGHNVFMYTRTNKELDSYTTVDKLFLPFTTIFSRKTYKQVSKIIKEKKIDIDKLING